MTNSTLSSNRTGWYALGCLLLVGSLRGRRNQQ